MVQKDLKNPEAGVDTLKINRMSQIGKDQAEGHSEICEGAPLTDTSKQGQLAPGF